MSLRPKRPCSVPGCPELVSKGRCPNHQRQITYRGLTNNARGYNYRWQKYTKYFKDKNPLCRACESLGIVTPTCDVDHIVPVTGPDDPLFWDENNHQPLCHSCHAKKTASERPGKSRRP